MNFAQLIGTIGSVLLFVYVLNKALKRLHKPSLQRKEDMEQLQESLKEMRNNLEEIKKQ